MEKQQIKEAYKIARDYANNYEDAVQAGFQMAINGEVLIEDDTIVKIE
jgi:hypothetical protein